MDATGSMSGLISMTKNSIHLMYERAGEILQEKGMDPNQMLLKIACYRSYSAPLDKFVEASSWESKAQALKNNFLDKISA